MTTEEVLAETATLLEQVGWCQGVLLDAQGRLCLLGALEAKLGSLSSTRAAPLFQAINQELDGCNPILWNDTPGRTQEEVTTMLRNAKRWL